jgi:pimeloyl-ACP methyl ester carboxylesterase
LRIDKGALMAETFVLLHGGIHGGWCYKLLATELRRRGHEVYTPTLTGFGERAHLTADSMETHILDVVNVMQYEDLHDVVLVGHSQGGFTVPFIAERVPERIKRVVWLTALVHADGERLKDADGNPDRASLPTYIRRGAPPMTSDERDSMIDAFLNDASPDLRAWLSPRLCGFSAVLRDTPSRLSDFLALGLPTGYVLATSDRALPPATAHMFASRLPGCRLLEVDADHDLMLSAPVATADVLEAMAQP